MAGSADIQCASCQWCEVDNCTTLSLKDRSGECKQVIRALSFHISCGSYCQGGYPDYAEVPLDWFCSEYARRDAVAAREEKG